MCLQILKTRGNESERILFMQSIKIMNNCFKDLKNITKADFYLCDNAGNILVQAGDRLTIKAEDIQQFIGSEANSQEIGGLNFFKVSGQEVSYCLIVNARGGDGHMYGRIAVSEIVNVMNMGSDNLDKEDFYRELLDDRISRADIYKEAMDLRISAEIDRVVYYIEIEEEMLNEAWELIFNIYAEAKDDYVLLMKNEAIVLIKSAVLQDETEEIAKQIVSMINTELMGVARVTYGNLKRDIRDLTEGYKEAYMAMQVSRIFFDEKSIASYDSLGIGRIIYQLPRDLCNTFLYEIFGENKKGGLSIEEENVIDDFLKNSLSIADSSRSLNTPRSSLVYKLDRIQKKTGLDIRCFEDAMTLKIALMVNKYMEHMNR